MPEPNPRRRDGSSTGGRHSPGPGGKRPVASGLRKGEANFLVEAQHVAGDFGLPPSYQRIQAELRGIRTRTPASFSRMEVDGRASLRGFKAFLRRALDEGLQGPQVFQEPGALICFELHHPPLDGESGVSFAYHGEGGWFTTARTCRQLSMRSSRSTRSH